MYKLQDIQLKPIVGNDSIETMFYRGNEILDFITLENGASKISKGSYFETFTYYGSLTVQKWAKYTFAYRFYLVLKIKGCIELTLFGHYVENKSIKKEYLGKFQYDFKEATSIVVPYPVSCKSQVVAFSISAKTNVVIYQSYYAADLEEEKFSNPRISLITTTYKKEDYIKKNILLLKDELLYEPEFNGRFSWNIVDNGKTLKEQSDIYVKILHNRNVGGAGGFAKGIIESLRQDAPTHVLLMDDDVHVSPESFKRLYRLLNILRDEYADYFVSGSMLNMDVPYIQHENTGRIDKDGYCVPLHSGRDLRHWDQIVLNEEIDDSVENRYAAWWFCCIPTTIARLDNLPIPIFVRGDDIEYSIRNNANFITLNGISIWHQGFSGKINPVMDFYQSKRNELVLNSILPNLHDVNFFGFLENLFWQELYKFNYSGTELIIEAIEDYMRGPDWLFSVDLYDELSKRKCLQYNMIPISDDIRNKINYEKLYKNVQFSPFLKFIYDYSYNGQARVPSWFFLNKYGVIPCNGGYYPCNQLLTTFNYAIDSVNDRYTVFKKDRKIFRQQKRKFLEFKNIYLEKKDVLAKRYQDYYSTITKESFWDDYLK